MPYETNDDLPEAVKSRIPSANGKSIFRNVFNSQHEKGLSEARCFASAWAALENAGFSEVDGKWIKKIEKADYQGREVELDKPFRLPDGENKKFGVYVMDGEKVKRVTFGDPNMEIRRDDKEARDSFRARHNCDAKKDKTTAGYWSCRMWDDDVTVSEMTKEEEKDVGLIKRVADAIMKILSPDSTPTDIQVYAEIMKVDEEQRIVYGWASVVTENGKPVIDRQGDMISPAEMEKMANNFMLSARMAKAMHTGDGVGEVIHSLPLTKAICDSLGLSSDREGWIIAMKIHSDEVWKDVKSKKLKAFSIGGKAISEEIDE